MLTVSDIQAKLLRRYPSLLRAWVSDENIFPVRLPVGQLPDNIADLREYIRDLELGRKRYGYRITTERRKSKKHGQQDFPVAVFIDTSETMLQLIDKTEEFQQFIEDVRVIQTSLPSLESWLVQHPEMVIEYHGKWGQLLEVCQFLVANPQPEVFIRELPVSPHTKFIEGHKRILRSLLDHLQVAKVEQHDFAPRYGLRTDEPLVRLRFLDRQLEKSYGLAIEDISIPISQLTSLDLRTETAIIVENKTSFLTLPSLSRTFAIFGSGFDVRGLKKIDWLKHCRILYWGDIDAQGFEILAMLRQILPHTQSIMMNQLTFEYFRKYAVAGTPAAPSRYQELTSEEQHLCQWLSDHNLRLEQERIHRDYVTSKLQQAIGL